MARTDYQALKDKVDIVDVIGRYISLEKKGSEYKGMCPFHDDTKPSLNVNQKKQLWWCPTCGDNKKGDVLDFLTAMGNTLPQAVLIIEGDLESVMPEKAAARTKREKAVTWSQVRPVVACADFRHYRHGEPDNIYTYRDSQGLIGYVCRFNLGDGEKETLPLIYAYDGMTYKWLYQGFKERPLYNADLLEKYPDLPVVVVEGEKAADWAEERSEARFVATTWIGGCNGVVKANLTLLQGRRLLLCPDNDDPGRKAMQYIHDHAGAANIKWGEIPKGSPKAWDIADSNWTVAQLHDYVRRCLRDPEPKRHDEDEDHFTYLGFEKADNAPVYVFYCKQSKTVFRFTSSGMTQANLMSLAPLDWWESKFGQGFQKSAVVQAASMLINTSYKVGIYSSKRLRGRGAWYDDSRIVIHVGDKLIVDGVDTLLGEFDTRYIYEIGESFNFNTENPLPADRSAKLLDLLNMFNWERKVNSVLLAGWCVLAPVCGALKWRPHAWITGGTGTGKSYVRNNVVRPLLGESAVDVQSPTSEAGIRQSLVCDARPVVLDEAESNDMKSQARMSDIIELARAASTEDGGKIVKGSASHKPMEFQIKSCFLFSSIIMAVDKGADKRRITTLSLFVPKNGKGLPEDEWKTELGVEWEKIVNFREELITDGFVSGLHARTAKLLPVILENAKIFGRAVADHLGSTQMGDQLGSMLAGAYSLKSENVINYKSALEYVKLQDWSEEKDNESIKDEYQLLSNLLQWKIKVDGYGDRTVGELVAIVSGKVADEVKLGANENTAGVTDGNIAIGVLKRHGVRVIEQSVCIARENSEIMARLKGSRWHINYARTLMRIDGAKSSTARFSAGDGERCVRLPISVINS